MLHIYDHDLQMRALDWAYLVEISKDGAAEDES